MDADFFLCQLGGSYVLDLLRILASRGTGQKLDKILLAVLGQNLRAQDMLSVTTCTLSIIGASIGTCLLRSALMKALKKREGQRTSIAPNKNDDIY